jgi:hypothetical protein
MKCTSGSLSKDSFVNLQSTSKATRSPVNLHEGYSAVQVRAFLAQQHCHFLFPQQSHRSHELTCEINIRRNLSIKQMTTELIKQAGQNPPRVVASEEEEEQEEGGGGGEEEKEEEEEVNKTAINDIITKFFLVPVSRWTDG